MNSATTEHTWDPREQTLTVKTVGCADRLEALTIMQGALQLIRETIVEETGQDMEVSIKLTNMFRWEEDQNGNVVS